jgi:DNA-binding response OmpR family regulator
MGKGHLKPEEICEPEEEEGKSVEGGEASSLPQAVGCAEETMPRKADVGAIMESDKPLLLLVEDNADVRRYVAASVEQEYRILEAVDGEDGWNKSIEHLPDIVVSDVMMPGMDGFALCDQLKRDERTSHIPVILLTAKASNQDKIEGFKTGADDYIMKPFEPAEVMARISNLIEQRKRIHEHFKKHGLYEIEARSITPVDQKFLQHALAVITKHLSDTAFGVESLAEEMAVSRSVLLKKIEALVGEPPSELIKRTRLTTAAQLIERRFGNISEIALEVGFSSPSHFADCFKRQFGTSPSHYHQIHAQQ